MCKRLFEITWKEERKGRPVFFVPEYKIWARTNEEACILHEKYNGAHPYKCTELVFKDGCLVTREQAEIGRKLRGGKITIPHGVEGIDVNHPFSWS